MPTNKVDNLPNVNELTLHTNHRSSAPAIHFSYPHLTGYQPKPTLLNLSIENRNFFILKNIKTGDLRVTKAGNFVLIDGSLSLQSFESDFKLTSWNADKQILEVLKIDSMPHKATSQISLKINVGFDAEPPSNKALAGLPYSGLDSSMYNYSTSFPIIDAQGELNHGTVLLIKSHTPNEWEMRLFVDGADVTPNINDQRIVIVANQPASFEFYAGAIVASVHITPENPGKISSFDIWQDGNPSAYISGIHPYPISLTDDGTLLVNYNKSGFFQPIAHLWGPIALGNISNLAGLRLCAEKPAVWQVMVDAGELQIGLPGKDGFASIQVAPEKEKPTRIRAKL